MPPDAALLLQHRDFVRAVARRLLRGPGTAGEADLDDVVQETFYAALATPPPEDRLKAWLGRVARNISIQRLRTRAARRRRECVVARPEGTRATADLAATLEWGRAVIDAVLELPEPYRGVILLRYYENLPPREVARRLGVPVNTVRTQHRRALAQLRGALAHHRSDWRAGLAALVTAGRWSLAGKAAAIAAVVCGALTLVAVHGALRTETASARSAPSNSTARGRAAVEPAIGLHDARPGAAEVAGTLAPDHLPEEGIRAQLYDGDIAVVQLFLRDGPFILSYPRGEGAHRLELRGPGVAPRAFPLPDPRADLGRIKMAPAASYGGRLVGGNGKPLAGAVVHFDVDHATRTDENGLFRFDLQQTFSTHVDRDGYLRGHLLYVCWNQQWAGPFYARPSGFQLAHRLVVEFDGRARIRFVRDGTPVPDATFSLYRYGPGGEPMWTGRTDSDGIVSPYWPSWIDTPMCSFADGRGGERIWMRLGWSEALATDVYEVDVGNESTASVRLRILEADGKTPAPGVFVTLKGTWQSYGEPVPHVELVGTTPGSGLMHWRILASLPREGAFVEAHVRAVDTRAGFAAVSGRFVESTARRALDNAELPPLALQPPPPPAKRPLLIDIQRARTFAYVRTALQGGSKEFGDSAAPARIRLADGRTVLQLFPDRNAPHDFSRVRVSAWGHSLTLTRAAYDRARAEGRILKMPPRSSLPLVTLRVVDSDGAPVAGARVGNPGTFTDTQGHAVYADRGVRRIVVTHRARGAAVELRDVKTHGDHRITVRLADPVVLRLRLVFPDSTPAAGAVARFLTPSGSPRSTADSEGWIQTPPIVPEISSLSVFAGDNRLPRKERWRHITHALQHDMAGLKSGDSISLTRIPSRAPNPDRPPNPDR